MEYVIRDGISQGQTNQQIIQRIKGKKSLDYKDGILSKTESEIERQVRTARSHISNATYIDTYKALGYDYVKVVATLDGRTCKYCASIDGDVYQLTIRRVHGSPCTLIIAQPMYHVIRMVKLQGCGLLLWMSEK